MRALTLPRATLLLLLLLLATYAAVLLADDVNATTVTTGTSDVQVVAAADQLRYCGISATETGGSAAGQVEVYAGTSNAGRRLEAPLRLNSGETSAGPMARCVPAPEGIYVDRTGPGTLLLVVYSQVSYPR